MNQAFLFYKIELSSSSVNDHQHDSDYKWASYDSKRYATSDLVPKTKVEKKEGV